MKSIRKLGIVIVSVSLLIALIPLAGAQDGFRTTFELEGPSEEGPLAGVDPTGAEFEWWHNHSGSREERLNEIIAEFNDENPWGITVNASNQGGYDDIYQKVVAGLTTGELPTLVVAYQNQSAAYNLGGGVADMDIFVNDPVWGFNDAEQADFIQAFFNQDIVGDKRIGFPPNRSLEAMYYNQTALEELGYDGPPTSWEEFEEMACRFTEEGWSAYDGDDTIGYEIRTDASNVAALTYGFGTDADIWDAEAGTYEYNNADTITALSFMQNLFNEGCASLIPESFADQGDFAAGKLLFTMGSTSGIPFYLSAIQEGGLDFEWGVAAIPYTEAPAVDIYGASVTILAGDNTLEQQLAAWLFVRWFTEPAQQARWAEVSNYFPVRISTTANLDGIFAQLPVYEQAWNLLLNSEGRVEPQTAGYDVVRDEVEAAFESILVEGADVEATLEELDVVSNEIESEFSLE